MESFFLVFFFSMQIRFPSRSLPIVRSSTAHCYCCRFEPNVCISSHNLLTHSTTMRLRDTNCLKTWKLNEFAWGGKPLKRHEKVNLSFCFSFDSVAHTWNFISTNRLKAFQLKPIIKQSSTMNGLFCRPGGKNFNKNIFRISNNWRMYMRNALRRTFNISFDFHCWKSWKFEST